MEFYSKVDTIGNEILLRGYRNGQPFREAIPYRPTFYLPSQSPTSKYRTIYNEPLEPFSAGNIKEAAAFLGRYRNVVNFHIYGMANWKFNFLVDRYRGQIEFDDSLLRIGYLDIEVYSGNGFAKTSEANAPITAISLLINGTVLTWGMKPYNNTADNVKYYHHETEKSMLTHFISVWQKLQLDIVSGYNISGYDIPYLVRRCYNVVGTSTTNGLSPWGIIRPKQVISFRGTEIDSYDIIGISEMDFLLLYKKFAFASPDSYKLDVVANLELGERKLDYSEFGSLHDLYEKDFQRFIDYNIRDVRLVEQMEAKRNLLRLAITMAYSAKINFQDVYMPTRVWENIIYDYLLSRNIVPPAKRASEDGGEFEGAYVKAISSCMYKWVMTFDAASLYPSLYRTFNIGPDTYKGRLSIDADLLHCDKHGHEDFLEKNNYALAANGTYYDKSQKSFMVELIEYYFQQRQEYRRRMMDAKKAAEIETDPVKKKEYKRQATIFNTFQLNFKISLNALYGAAGNAGFKFFDVNIAEAITSSAQLAIRWAEKHINEYLNELMKTDGVEYVVYMDTDSCFVNMGPLIEKYKVPAGQEVDFLDRFAAEKIQPRLNEWFGALKERLNAAQQAIEFKREKICDKVIWTGKKRYICSILDSEGVRYKQAHIEVTGIETVRSTTPEFCRAKLKEAFAIIVQGTETELQEFVVKTKEQFFKESFNSIARPTGAKDLKKYANKQTIYAAKTPMHIRASLLYNKLLRDKKLTNKYEEITDGDKIRYIYLTLPNPIHENVIAAPQFLPEEFGLAEYFDRDTQFSKTFTEPLQAILAAVGWQIQKLNTLEDMFA